MERPGLSTRQTRQNPGGPGGPASGDAPFGTSGDGPLVTATAAPGLGPPVLFWDPEWALPEWSPLPWGAGHGGRFGSGKPGATCWATGLRCRTGDQRRKEGVTSASKIMKDPRGNNRW